MCIHNEIIDIHDWSMAIHNWNKDSHNWNNNFHNWILDVHNWIMDTHNWIIKSPAYRECLYVFVPVRTHRCRRRRRRPQTFVHAITSEQLFGFLSFWVGWIYTCRLDYLMRFSSIFVLTLTWNWIFKVKYGICYNAATNGLMATKRKANILFVL